VPATGRRRWLRAGASVVAAGLLAGGLAACTEKGPEFRNTDITGSGIAKDGFTLTDHTGVTRTLADYRGKAVLIFFGFTHCPDVCPTTLVEAAEAIKLLGPKGDRLQVLFVTVDPERDTPESLARYVPAFHPSFVGLWGDPDTIARTAKDFKVFYQKTQESSSGSYSIDHTAASYLFDTEGRVRLFIRYGAGPEGLAHDVGLLLD
jgi:protein SCO1/2